VDHKVSGPVGDDNILLEDEGVVDIVGLQLSTLREIRETELSLPKGKNKKRMLAALWSCHNKLDELVSAQLFG
jgi:hypothetical protein